MTNFSFQPRMVAVVVAAFSILGVGVSNTDAATLQAHLKFDGDLTDSTGNGFDGTAVGDAAAGTTNGLVGGAASFDGSGDAVNISATVLNPDVSSNASSFSLSFFEFSPDVNGDNAGYMISTGANSTGTSGFFIRRSPDNDGGTSSDELNSKVSSENFVFGGDNLFDTPRGQWNHVALTVDTVGLTANLYINGSLADTLSYSGAVPLGTNVVVGDRAAGGRDFLGLIDDLQIYDGVLTSGEVAFLNSNPGSVIPEPASLGLLGLGGLCLVTRRRSND